MIRLYLDEDIKSAPKIEKELNHIGYDVLSTQTAGRDSQRISDDDQLRYATELGRVLVSFNIRDFTGKTNHKGLLLGEQRNFSRNIAILIRALKNACERLTPEEIENQERRIEDFR